MVNYIEAIINSTWFYFLFGGSGILIIVLGVMQYLKKEKEKSNSSTSDINVNISINDNPQNTKPSSDIQYNLNIEKDNQTINVPYEKYSFRSDEFYIQFLSQVEEKKKGRDDISYE